MALFRLNFCCSVTFKGMHWFHSNFAELYITVNYRSSWIFVIIHQIWLSYGSFSNWILLLCWYWFPINNFCRKALILLKVCRRIYHCKIQVKFDISNHLQNFGWVMALFWPSFCWFVDTGFHLLNFAGLHWFYWKFAEGFIIVKYRSSSIFVIIHKILGKLGPFLSHLLVAGCDIGVRFSVRPSVRQSVRPSVRLSTFMSKFDIYVKVSILINYKTKQPSNLALNISLTSWLWDIGVCFSVRLSVCPSVCQHLCRSSTFMSKLVF